MKYSYVFMADGFEEIEALTAVDIMRRAGMPVRTVSISSSLSVTGTHGVEVKADAFIDDVDASSAEWLVLPGGLPGAENLRDCVALGNLLKSHAAAGGKIAAICAAPAFVLGTLGLLAGEKATGYPGTEAGLHCREVIDAPVVVSGNFVLGNGPANAMKWALAIVAESKGEEAADTLAGDLLLCRSYKG